ncbi:RNA-processing protein [Candidatus Micrarchaeota archaeon]|nr:RNA-processing protein [Candidatus Micrarchaeota archaeon]
MEVINIPKERVAVLIGEKGKTKELIEKNAAVKLKISSEGEVVLSGDEDKVFFAKYVIKAIGRGFSPKTALKLLKEHLVLEIINLKEYVNTDSAVRRIKSRVIGEKGRIKKEMESATECRISVYGHTISIIGPIENIEYAREAIMKIIGGSQHSTVLNYLSKVRREIFKNKIIGD